MSKQEAADHKVQGKTEAPKSQEKEKLKQLNNANKIIRSRKTAPRVC